MLFTDISSKIRQHRINKLHRFQDEILANMNHNLKTPLNGIQLNLDGLKNITQNADQMRII